MDETWKDILGYEGLYQSSTLGNIRSVGHYVTGSNRYGTFYNRLTRSMTLKSSVCRSGYRIIHLCKNSVKSVFTVHRLIAETFIGVRPCKYTINHKDGDKRNNCLDNLEYVTQRENVKHAMDTGLTKRIGVDNVNAKLLEEDVRSIVSEYVRGEVSQGILASKYGVSRGMISHIITKRSWKHLLEARDV